MQLRILFSEARIIGEPDQEGMSLCTHGSRKKGQNSGEWKGAVVVIKSTDHQMDTQSLQAEKEVVVT